MVIGGGVAWGVIDDVTGEMPHCETAILKGDMSMRGDIVGVDVAL